MKTLLSMLGLIFAFNEARAEFHNFSGKVTHTSVQVVGPKQNLISYTIEFIELAVAAAERIPTWPMAS